MVANVNRTLKASHQPGKRYIVVTHIVYIVVTRTPLFTPSLPSHPTTKFLLSFISHKNNLVIRLIIRVEEGKKQLQ